MAFPTYTFGDQQNLLSILLGDSGVTSDDMFPQTIRETMLNRGEIRFAMDARDLRGYATGSVASQAITLPTDWYQMHTLVVNNQDITRFEIALQDYERYLYNTDARWYQWEESGVQVLKLLSSVFDGYTYKLWYFRVPANALVNTTDTSEHKLQHREAPVYWAGAQFMTQIGKTDLAGQYLALYQQMVQQALEDIKEQFMDRPVPKVDTGDEQTNTSHVDVEGKGYMY